MTIFWIIAGALTVLVALLLSWPLLRRPSVKPGESNRAINASIYRDQLAELVRERDSRALSDSDYRDAHAELERRVIEDTRNDAAAPSVTTGGRSLKTAVTLLLAIPLAAVPLYLWLGTPAAFNAAPAQASAPHGTEAGGAMGDLNQLAAKLADKLAKNPDNPQGWVMLGRTYKILERYDEAEKAYLRAGSAANAEPALMLERIELAANRNGGRIEGDALKMLNSVLQKEPGNPQALFLAGYGAFNRQDYRGAIGYWEPLQSQVAPDSQDARNLAAGLAEARSRLGEKAPAIVPAAAAVAAPSAPAASASAAAIRGKVNLAPALASKVKPGDLVFIFARAADGPPIPLAVIRASVADLPLEFTLDDSKAMSPQAKLSLFKAVRVEARVAKSGDPIAKPGDLTGSIESVKVGTSGLALTIDRVLP